MPIVCEKCRDVNPERVTKGYASTEPWECYAANADGSVNENGYVDPDTVIDDAGLPGMGHSHPKFPSAQVIGKRVSQVIANWSVMVQLTYRSWGTYSGGPRQISSASSASRLIQLPVWRKKTDGAVEWWEEDVGCGTQVHRAVAIRTETRFLGGNEVDTVQTAIANNVGQLYQLPVGSNVWYRLSEQTSAVYGGGTYTRADYRFERDAAMPLIVVNDPVWALGNDVKIPALPPLYFWASYPDPTSSALPPVIVPVPPLAVVGTRLPGL